MFISTFTGIRALGRPFTRFRSSARLRPAVRATLRAAAGFSLSAPAGPDDEENCAKQILSNLVRRAYRRPVDDEDLKTPMKFYREGRAEGDFEAGIEMALSSVLVNPQFLFRIERDPPNIPSGTAYPNRRRGVGVATVILSLEQHTGRRIARSGSERRTQPAGSARTTSAAHVGRQAFAIARHQFCGSVALSSQSGFDQSGYAPVSGFRRQPAAGVRR